MKVILISNYENDLAQSMNRFAEMLEQGLSELGITAIVIRPKTLFGKLKPSGKGFGKWLGYIDKYIIFPFSIIGHARIARREGETVFHICDHSNSMYLKYLSKLPQLVTCHDLLAVRSARGEVPQNKTSFTGQCLQSWILGHLKKASYVVSVSKSTEDDLKRLTSHKEGSCEVIYNGLNYPYSDMGVSDVDEHLGKLFTRVNIRAPKNFLLHVGSPSWYKNRLGLLKIYSSLLKIRPNVPSLLFAGKQHTPACLKFIEEESLGDKVIYVGTVSNIELNALYSGAEAFLMPSLSEGFGWPIIEALASNCIVVTSNRAPMNEIGGQSALYIDPESPESAARKIDGLLAENFDEKQGREKAGVEHSKQFSSSIMIEAYCRIYKKIM
jgi:glycosyltransferase involved in cell wall biosynthesis